MSHSSNLYAPLLEPYTYRRRLFLGQFCAYVRNCLRCVCSSVKASCGAFIFCCMAVWNAAWKEPAKTIHAFKMGLALTVSFLLVLLDAPYALFGSHVIWAIMTLIVVFEFSIGATLSKGLNRGFGTLLAGLLAVIVGQLADMCGYLGHPVMVSLSVFVTGGVVTFAKLWPTFKPYEFGFRTFLLTFSLIMVVEYRQGDPAETAVDRFIVITIGGAMGLTINILLLPLWAGEELHEAVSKNFARVAESLEVCVNEYLKGTVLERVPSKMFLGLAADDPVWKSYQPALMSGSKEEALANFAIWEPPHGRFKMCKYPWQSYVKIGAVLRHCTYSVVALHGCLRSAIQAPLDVRLLFEQELREISIESARLLRTLGQQVQNMEKGDHTRILDDVRHAVDRLQQSLYLNSYLLVRGEMGFSDDYADDFAVSVVPELEVPELERQGHDDHHLEGFFHTDFSHEIGGTSWHDELTSIDKRAFRKLHSWPSRPIDDFDFAKDSVFEQRVRVLQSASALSLGTFANLLIEVALRLDYVVEAVEELGELANFNDPVPQVVINIS